LDNEGKINCILESTYIRIIVENENFQNEKKMRESKYTDLKVHMTDEFEQKYTISD